MSIDDHAYGIICENHGKVELTREQYVAQMDHPDSLWKCPICKFPSDFDEDKYEAVFFPQDE